MIQISFTCIRANEKNEPNGRMTTHTTPLDIPFPPDPNPRKPKMAVPPGSWDSHFHIFGPPHRFPYADTRRYSPPTAPIEHWLSVSKAIGIERGFVVTPSVHDLDPAVTLDAIARAEGRIRGMVRADSNMTSDEVKRLHAGGIRGLRFPFAAVVRRAFNEKEFHANIALIQSTNWVVEFQIDGDALDVHSELIGNVPLPTIIDEFAGIQPKDGLDQPKFRTLLDLLAKPNVYLKLICADRFLSQGQSYESIVAMSRAVIAKAPDRIIWGTDWPHSYIFEANGIPNDGDLVDMLLDFAPDEAVRKKILVDNPTRLFDFD
jgi:predicted TIM-barrel fold metal-dependent hydrolase